MRWTKGIDCSPIGLDIGSRYIKAAQLSMRAGQLPVLTAAMVLERVNPDSELTQAEVRRLINVLDRRGFVGRRIVACVPNEALLTSVFDLPKADSGAPLGQIAAAELARAHRHEPDAMEVAFWPLPAPMRSREGMPVMAAGCLHETMNPLLDALESQGLDVVALDATGWAMARACQPLFAQRGDEDILAMVDLGWRTGTLALLHGKTMIYKRSLAGAGYQSVIEAATGKHELTAEVIEGLLAEVGFESATQTGRPDPLVSRLAGPLEMHLEQMAQELSMSLAYVSHQYPNSPLGRLWVMGGGARIRGLCKRLSNALDMPVNRVQLPDICTVDPNCADANAGSLTIAVGLAAYVDEVTL